MLQRLYEGTAGKEQRGSHGSDRHCGTDIRFPEGRLPPMKNIYIWCEQHQIPVDMKLGALHFVRRIILVESFWRKRHMLVL